MRLLTRLANLVRGVLARWVRRREQRDPDAVYEAAIQQRLTHYGRLRQAAAGVLYLKGKLAAELAHQSAALASLRRQLDVAVETDDDASALALITHRDEVAADVTRVTAELTELTKEADAAKENLIAFRREIARLREERVRTLARLANAKARLRVQSALGGLGTDADIRALEEVREHVERLVTETRVQQELGDGELEKRLANIRNAEAEKAARAQLDELKRARREKLVPLVLPKAAPAVAR
jgi:phage shock protein A